MSGTNAEILCYEKNGIQKVVLNNKRKKNAITQSMYKALVAILEEASSNEKICMVVLTGNGNFFSSGNYMSLNSEGFDVDRMLSGYKNFIDSLITFPKLLVAIVNGPAIGIAVTMLPLFDMVFASDQAYFQTPFSEIGFSGEGCSTYTFPRIMGESKASEMLYMACKMSATEAKQYRLVSDVYNSNKEDKIWAYLNNVSTLSFESITTTKQLVRKWNKELLLKVNAEEANALAERIRSPDFAERLMNRMSQKNKL